ncbi:MAG TPA: CDP-alcohol phosphatidyltransferase family protein, partial [Leptospiraceae bacterium]|nr:CDP-alcohol phosphatidyltransferase family protein [Leptospiraceae bacterium]
TDFFDGYLARKLNQTSYIGSILDPVADKFVVLSFFTFFYFSGTVPLFYFLLILVRDIAQLLSVPVLLLWKKISFKVAPKLTPKIGTALNFVILGTAGFVFLFPDIQFSTSIQSPEMIFMILVYAVSSAIELYILFTYIPRFVQIYRGTHDTFE